MDPTTFHIEEGPTLNTARIGHACGLFISPNGGPPKIIAAGGYYEDTVEVLDPSASPGQGWEQGIKSIHVME